MIARVIKRISKNLYYRLRYSTLYEKYLNFKNRDRATWHESESYFFENTVSKPSLIFDIGANQGDYSAIYLESKATVIAVEPDKLNLDVLGQRFRGNPKFKLVSKAISDKNGTETLFVNEHGSGFNTLSAKWKNSLQDPNQNRWSSSKDFRTSYKVQTTTLDDLIKEFGMPDFIKIDVEGYEFKVISTLRNNVKVINFEANLPEFKDEILMCVEHLLKLDGSYKFNIGVDCEADLYPWMNGAEFLVFVNATEFRYLDIWAKNSLVLD